MRASLSVRTSVYVHVICLRNKQIGTFSDHSQRRTYQIKGTYGKSPRYCRGMVRLGGPGPLNCCSIDPLFTRLKACLLLSVPGFLHP